MPEKAEKRTKSDTLKNLFLFGCVLPFGTLTLILAVSAAWLLLKKEVKAPPDYIKSNEAAVSKRLEEIDERAAARKKAEKPVYDIDQTAMALFSIEKALSEAKTFEQLTPFILQKESDLVAPDAAKLKYRFFNVYKKILDAKDDSDETESIYDATTNAIKSVSSVVGYNPVKGISFDREQARKIWEESLSKTKASAKAKKRLRKVQDEMLDILFDYARTNAKYAKEWDALCAKRDRAYLAAYEGDWDEVVSAASAAIEASPTEKEAHILLATALMHSSKETDRPAAEAIVKSLLKTSHGQLAPAYLLRGVIAMENGNVTQAVVDFDQAAAYYPKQQEEISDKLNLYKKRLFLNKSKEGRIIVNAYRGIMSGAGFFSPDFQMAKLLLKQEKTAKAKRKIFDHFFRRRGQGRWDQVLMDFRFCGNNLKTDFKDIFAGDKMCLEIEPAWFTNSVIVSIKNDSSKPIHNLTLLLCARFTDMFIGDYVSFPVGESVAILNPGDTVTVGRRNIGDVTLEKLGVEKKWKDIIEYGAVIISDEMIAWISPAKRGEIKQPPKHAEERNGVGEEKENIGSTLKEKASEILDSTLKAAGAGEDTR